MKGADPYISGHGDLRYDVTHYALSLTYALPSNKLDGTAEITCRAVGELSQVALDLRLKPLKVSVAGRKVSRHRVLAGKLTITLAEPVAAGEEFTVTVKFSGNPAPIAKRGQDAAGWEELDDGVIVASQPHGAPSWFPCNDRPSSKATYELTLTTAADYQVEFSGELVTQQRRGAQRTWTFRQTQPISSYLATVQIGRYQVITQKSVVPLRVVGPAGIKNNGFSASFGRQPEMMALFVDRFGPYPFTGYTTVITDDPLEIPLESASLSTFGRNFAAADWDSVRLVAHELAHQWFGNAVTAREWRDIWLHEGFACYAEWLWSEASGQRSVADWARHHHAILAGASQKTVLSDPTASEMFEDWVYKRGALTLHALRAEVGDQVFFDILRSWVATHRGGSVSTADFVAHCSEVAGRDLAAWFGPWLHETALPPLP
ncbi:M1 family metallopeptidase [Ornithinimicrobium ciconiae]|uniref:M1 family metallopeptidase n=1 Tax=Ornithinimicrobium ciconiae TaxID=2594265 RepID=UPI001D19130A|nr:M1 family metallopeptidase [Ornithinimicrobium ciconiae]